MVGVVGYFKQPGGGLQQKGRGTVVLTTYSSTGLDFQGILHSILGILTRTREFGIYYFIFYFKFLRLKFRSTIFVQQASGDHDAGETRKTLIPKLPD